MSHPQTLRIPFQEFGFFTQLSQESSPKISSHTHILEENLLNICKYHKKVLPLQILKTQHMCNNQLNVL